MTTARRPSLVDQVRQGLLDDLVAGKLVTGEKLPNEDRLAERFSVSRATVREAVLGLLEAGYLTRRHGSGTYVTKAPRSRHALDTTVSYTAMIRDSGHTPGETELHYAYQYRIGQGPLIVWPEGYPSGGLFAHIGSVKTEDML